MCLSLLFYFFSSLVLICAIITVISTNAIYSILFLILLFFNFSCSLLLIGSEFLGILFLIVYVGAVAILFLFVIMMLNIKFNIYSDKLGFYTDSLYIKLLNFNLVFFIFIQFLIIINADFLSDLNLQLYIKKYLNIYYFKSSLIYYNWFEEQYLIFNVYSIGYVLYTFYRFLVLLSGLLLLVAMIGSIILTFNQSFNYKKQEIFLQVYRKSFKNIAFVKFYY
uniref:NADH dehydrogenase subunit 6 n=1 Tax=Neorhodella cyanea TaxID=131155 RepID=UPI001FCDBAC3|nr:NADH dehydrogenase subunit 6 [Neorhodella cyanea]UNJ18801.1 NADH dehydrogenase subunit 6 [Neorhodella cyanea]